VAKQQTQLQPCSSPRRAALPARGCRVWGRLRRACPEDIAGFPVAERGLTVSKHPMRMRSSGFLPALGPVFSGDECPGCVRSPRAQLLRSVRHGDGTQVSWAEERAVGRPSLCFKSCVSTACMFLPYHIFFPHIQFVDAFINHMCNPELLRECLLQRYEHIHWSNLISTSLMKNAYQFLKAN